MGGLSGLVRCFLCLSVDGGYWVIIVIGTAFTGNWYRLTAFGVFPLVGSVCWLRSWGLRREEGKRDGVLDGDELVSVG